jgi:hypothetical protein
MLLLRETDALFPGLGLDDLVALEHQHVPDKLADLVVVLDDEDYISSFATAHRDRERERRAQYSMRQGISRCWGGCSAVNSRVV